MSRAWEVNFDGLVGPTHNYAGLAPDNLASQKFAQSISRPRDAALEGLAKMKLLLDLRVKQAVLPPPLRPDVAALRRLGFYGDDAEVLQHAWKTWPALLAACSSSSAMWAANAATISPSSDTRDGKVHITPANLVSQLHRSLEVAHTSNTLRSIFAAAEHFVHHDPLPSCLPLCDEGAANFTRLAMAHDRPGLEIFVYSRRAGDKRGELSGRFAGRQTLEACEAVARLHQLPAERMMLVQQNPAAIAAGVFHNDVIAVGNLNVLLYHELAYVDQDRFEHELADRFKSVCGGDLHLIKVLQEQVPLEEAVSTYLFNSQIVSLPDGTMALIAPCECQHNARVQLLIERMIHGDHPVDSVHYVEVRQSMQNGGGPACLRLRVVLDEEELVAAHPGVFLTASLLEELAAWVKRHYRQQLRGSDLAEPQLLEESRRALAELDQLLHWRA